MRISLFAAAAAVTIATAGGALAALPRDKLLSAMHARHEGMKSIGKSNKAIARQIQGRSPDLSLIRLSARQIAKLSRQGSGWFPQGSGPESGKTGARPEIWQDPRDFAARLRNFQVAARAFDAAAAGSDVGAIRARFADMGGTCKACHDKYRRDMHH